MTHHEPSTVGNPGVTLCQEWAMRRGEYDDRASVSLSMPGTTIPVHVPFAVVVASRGLDRAVADVHCLWLSMSEIRDRNLLVCVECREIRHG